MQPKRPMDHTLYSTDRLYGSTGAKCSLTDGARSRLPDVTDSILRAGSSWGASIRIEVNTQFGRAVQLCRYR